MSNTRTVEISSSIMCCDFLRLGEEIKNLEEAGSDYFHIDVMDGTFVNNFAMNGYEIKAIKKITDVPLDIHLMIEEPLRYINYFAELGSDMITVHLESCRHINRTLQKIKGYGIKSALALSPGTSHLLLEPIVDYIDMVLVMSVNPGFAGQEFIPSTIKKVEQTRHLLDDLGYEHIDIQVDGSINTKTIPPLYYAGASIFVAGTSGLFFGDMKYKKNINDLKSCVKKT